MLVNHILILITDGICVTICLVSLFCLLQHFTLYKESTIHLLSQVKYFSIISITLFTFAIITLTFDNIYTTDKDLLTPSSKMDIGFILNLLSLFGWIFGVSFLYLLFLSRLTKTYQDSTFQLSSLIRICTYIALTLLLFLSFAALTLFGLYYYYVGNDLSTNNLFLIAQILIAITEILHLFISVVLIYMFVYRLFKLFVIMSYDNIHVGMTHTLSLQDNYGSLDVEDSNSYTNDTSLSISESQQSILIVIAKQSILSITAIISSQICFIGAFILTQTWDVGHGSFYKFMYTISIMLFGIDCVINCVCILLTFSFQHKVYMVLCGRCHQCCQNCCIKYVKNKIQKQERETIDSTLDQSVELSNDNQ
eukprot:23516_1